MKKFFHFLFCYVLFYTYAELPDQKGLGSLGDIRVEKNAQDPGYQHNKKYYMQNPYGMSYPDPRGVVWQYIRSGTTLPFEEYLALQGFELEKIPYYLNWYNTNNDLLVGAFNRSIEWEADLQTPPEIVNLIKLYQSSRSPLSFQEYLSIRGYTPEQVRSYCHHYNVGFSGYESSFIPPAQWNGSLPQEVEQAIKSL